MNAISESKSLSQNRLEGFVLTALFQGLPIYATAVLLLKISGTHAIVRAGGSTVFFAVAASLVYAMLTPWVGSKFPNAFKNGYEPLFFDSSLSFSEKIARWRVQPMASLQLVTTVMLMSVLAVGVASIR
jgi:hypothetical protein